MRIGWRGEVLMRGSSPDQGASSTVTGVVGGLPGSPTIIRPRRRPTAFCSAEAGYLTWGKRAAQCPRTSTPRFREVQGPNLVNAAGLRRLATGAVPVDGDT